MLSAAIDADDDVDDDGAVALDDHNNADDETTTMTIMTVMTTARTAAEAVAAAKAAAAATTTTALRMALKCTIPHLHNLDLPTASRIAKVVSRVRLILTELKSHFFFSLYIDKCIKRITLINASNS